MEPEQEARQKIDDLLKAAGWVIQDYKNLNLGAALGVAVREFPLLSGEADYLLFVDRKAVGAVEAKPVGTTLSGVEDQSQKYLTGIPANVPYAVKPLPFAYESTGVETYFRDLRDPDTRSRRVFAFHKPETLRDWLTKPDTLRMRLRKLPPLIRGNLYNCQFDAIKNLEESFKAGRPRALIQMATGSGKTYTAVSFVYRLIKFAGAKRVLFLVDRNNLARQALREFQQYVTPDDGRKFTELYNVQHLTSNAFDPVSKVCITTIQRVYSMLKGEELLPELEEQSMFEMAMEKLPLREVAYNSDFPIESFDFIITDECHRSIYNVWRQVLEYFDAFIIGLTATPSKQTLGFFNNNLVMEYTHDRAVADNVNVPYEVYRIRTAIGEKGSKIPSGFYVDKRDKLTRKTWWEKIEDEVSYEAKELDRSVVAPDQIRTVIRTFKEKLFTELYPGRKDVPKTLVFAKDDSHAEDIVRIIREEFGKGNEFCKKITYKTTGEKPEDLIASFRNSYNPRIAVTVDMIATGTDIKPLECLLFMRDVKSRIYFEQMKGRGTRTISSTDLQSVTSDARYKTHFFIIDAVGVCESIKTDEQPLERKRGVPFDKLLMNIALGNRDQDNLSSLADRLSRLNKELTEQDRKEVEEVGGKNMHDIINSLLDAVDPDKINEKAKEIFKVEEPSEKQLKNASDALAKEACTVFDNEKLRNMLIDFRKRSEQLIDTVSLDTVTYAGFDPRARENAMKIVQDFKAFIEKNKDELTALQIIYSKPYAKRRLTYEEIKKLADAIRKPPYYLTEDKLWLAFEQLEKAKVRGAGPKKLLTNIISLVRFAIEEAPVLEPFSDTVDRRFAEWLKAQEKLGNKFTPEQMEWLMMIKDHIATSLEITIEDFDLTPFTQKGGAVKAYAVFGKKLGNVLEELNKVLINEQ